MKGRIKFDEFSRGLLDDILDFFKNVDDNMQHLNTIIDTLRDNKVAVSVDKRILFVEE